MQQSDDRFYDFLIRRALAPQGTGDGPVVIKRINEWSITRIKKILPHFRDEVANTHTEFEKRFHRIYDNFHKIERHGLRGIKEIQYAELGKRFSLFGLDSEIDKVFPWYKVISYGYPNPAGSLKTMLQIVEMEEH